MHSPNTLREHARRVRRQQSTTMNKAKPSPSIVSDDIYAKYLRTSSGTPNGNYPHLTDSAGHWVLEGVDWWTSGFYPGTLYLLNERAGLCPGSTNADWLGLARKWSKDLVGLSWGNSQGHDQGFLAIPFAHELEINPGSPDAKATLLRYAKLLADRFSSVVGVTKSWDQPEPNFPVIMDNMMNLELLYQAADLGSPDHYRDIANSHANITSHHHIRDDGSSYHVVNYNSATGAVSSQFTAQGYANWSTWSRGQSWGIHGYVSMYEHTGNSYYLDVSKKMGSLFLHRLDSSPGTVNGVSPWDFDAPAPTSVDTSATAIAATAFLHIAAAEGDSADGNWWRDQAVKLLSNAAESYFSPNDWDSILMNGTSNHPIGKQDTGIVYGDYYFVKAGNMMLKQKLIQCDGTAPPPLAGPPNISNTTKFTSQGTATTVSTPFVDIKAVNSPTGISAGDLSAEPMLAFPWVGLAALLIVVKSMCGL